MATVQQSIDLRVPVHTIYNQLTQFEDYPQFMEEVQAVKQLDDTHLHWTTTMSNRPAEWDAEITEQESDRCIAWHNTSGPTNSARVEVQPLSEDSSRLTFTFQSEPQQVPGASAGNNEEDIARRLQMDLARLKDFVERRGSETGAWRGEVHGAQVTTPSSSQQTSSYAAGSEGWAGDEDPTAPMTSSSPQAEMQPKRPAQTAQTAQPGNTAAEVGAAGGTDASAGAMQSGSKGLKHEEGPRAADATGVPGSPGGTIAGESISAAAGATTGGTGLGEAASADDTRTGTGTTAGSGSSLTGGGTSAGRDAGKGS